MNCTLDISRDWQCDAGLKPVYYAGEGCELAAPQEDTRSQELAGSPEEIQEGPALAAVAEQPTDHEASAGLRYAQHGQVQHGDQHMMGQAQHMGQATEEQGSAQSTVSTPPGAVHAVHAVGNMNLGHAGSTEGLSEPRYTPDTLAHHQTTAPYDAAPTEDQGAGEGENLTEPSSTEDPDAEPHLLDIVRRGMRVSMEGNDKGCQVCLPMPHDVWRLPAPRATPAPDSDMPKASPAWEALDPMTILAMAAAELPTSPLNSQPVTADDPRSRSSPAREQDYTAHSARYDTGGRDMEPSRSGHAAGGWDAPMEMNSRDAHHAQHGHMNMNHMGMNHGSHHSLGNGQDDDGAPTGAGKRPRLAWTPDLHARFVKVVEVLGLHTAVPKTILRMMDVKGLTREQVASHLQKYRLYMKKGGGGSQTALNSNPGDVYMAPYRAPPLGQQGSVSLTGKAAIASAINTGTNAGNRTKRSRSSNDLAQLAPTPTATPPASASQVLLPGMKHADLQPLDVPAGLAVPRQTVGQQLSTMHQVVPITQAQLQSLLQQQMPQLAMAQLQSNGQITQIMAGHQHQGDQSVHGGDAVHGGSTVHTVQQHLSPSDQHMALLQPMLASAVPITVTPGMLQSLAAANVVTPAGIAPTTFTSTAHTAKAVGSAPSTSRTRGSANAMTPPDTASSLPPADVPPPAQAPARSSALTAAALVANASVKTERRPSVGGGPLPVPDPSLSPMHSGSMPAAQFDGVSGGSRQPRYISSSGLPTSPGGAQRPAAGGDGEGSLKRKLPEDCPTPPAPAAPAIRMVSSAAMLPPGFNSQHMTMLLQQQAAQTTGSGLGDAALQPVITLSAGGGGGATGVGRRRSSASGKLEAQAVAQPPARAGETMTHNESPRKVRTSSGMPSAPNAAAEGAAAAGMSQGGGAHTPVARQSSQDLSNAAPRHSAPGSGTEQHGQGVAQAPGFAGAVPFSMQPVQVLGAAADGAWLEQQQAGAPSDAETGAVYSSSGGQVQAWAGGSGQEFAGGAGGRVMTVSAHGGVTMQDASRYSPAPGAIMMSADGLARLQMTQQGMQIVPVMMGRGQGAAGLYQAPGNGVSLGGHMYATLPHNLGQQSQPTMHWVTAADGTMMAVRSEGNQRVMQQPPLAGAMLQAPVYMVQADGTLTVASGGAAGGSGGGGHGMMVPMMHHNMLVSAPGTQHVQMG